MLEELLPYYERELTYLRELSGEFAQRYPKIARRLSLEGDQSEDPHVERIIESFAFLAARIHRKLDDEFPEITEAFMQVLYPHYTRPFPSCSILQFETDPDKPEITASHRIPRHHPAISPPVGGMPCRFRTCYDVDLYPLCLKSARVQLAQGSEHLRRLAPGAAAALSRFACRTRKRPIRYVRTAAVRRHTR
jgi:type VI secretion system protein ImpG